jgi:hypothetical protein
MANCMICKVFIDRSLSACERILCAKCLQPVYKEYCGRFPPLDWGIKNGWTWESSIESADRLDLAVSVVKVRMGHCPQCGDLHA